MECPHCKKKIEIPALGDFAKNSAYARDGDFGFGYIMVHFADEYRGFIEALPQYADGYDFTWCENSLFHEKMTSIGVYDRDSENTEFLKRDVEKPITDLTPKPFVNMTDISTDLGACGSTDKEYRKVVLCVAANLDKVLLPGGRIRLGNCIDYNEETIIDSKDKVLGVILNYLYDLGYTTIWDHLEDESGIYNEADEEYKEYEIILQKP